MSVSSSSSSCASIRRAQPAASAKFDQPAIALRLAPARAASQPDWRGEARPGRVSWVFRAVRALLTRRAMNFRSIASLPFALLVGACTADVQTPTPAQTCSATITKEILVTQAQGLDPFAVAGICLDSAPPPAAGALCTVIEARPASDACACDPASARLPVTDEALIATVLADPHVQKLGVGCLCAIPKLEGAAEAACRTDPSDPLLLDGAPVDGFCYVGETDNPEVMAACPAPAGEVRFAGKGAPAEGDDGDHLVLVLCPSPTSCGGN
jgi:hypothetical protein